MQKNYYIFKSGNLKKKDNSLIFKASNKENTYIPIEEVDSIYLLGEHTFNTKLINFLSKKGICVHFFNYYGFYTGSFYPKEQLNSGFLFVEQVKHYIDYDKRLKIAKEILNGAASNIYRNVRYYNERGRELGAYLEKINKLKKDLSNCSSIEELMGVEGNIRKTYYSTFNLIINQEINFEKRVKNPPDNMINSLISFCNMMVYTSVLSEIYHTQLSPLVSFLHQPGERRFSLSLDIAEIFKPLIADRLIFSILNKNKISKDDFSKELNYIYLNEKAKKVILQDYDDSLRKTIRHRELKRDVSYRRLIRLELYKLVKHITGEKEYESFKIWW